MRWGVSSLFAALSLALLACGPRSPVEPKAVVQSQPAPSADPYPAEFWRHWSDGAAELTGYELTAVRYGEKRSGTAVTIFVTEPFSESERVKADPGVHPPSDEFPVMKLNLVRDYPTGIYDYNEMLSTFIGLKPAGGRAPGSPAKVSFSSQEWCGHIYAQALPAGNEVSVTAHSYFDRQADQLRNIPARPGGFHEDAIWLWARGMAAPFLQPGESVQKPMLPSFFQVRGNAGALSWQDVTLERSIEQERLITALGPLQAERWSVRDGATTRWTIWVEAGLPHRILRWEGATGESGAILRSERLKYWEMNGLEGQKTLSRLGLRPRPARTM